ncbi:MAG: ABC transporter substrate-binding protein, partial [Actinomycetota bacterium]
MLSSCPSGRGSDGNGSSGNGNGGGPTPARGGELVVAYPHEPATLNPFVTGGDATATRDLVRPLMPALY